MVRDEIRKRMEGIEKDGENEKKKKTNTKWSKQKDEKRKMEKEEENNKIQIIKRTKMVLYE